MCCANSTKRGEGESKRVESPAYPGKSRNCEQEGFDEARAWQYSRVASPAHRGACQRSLACCQNDVRGSSRKYSRRAATKAIPPFGITSEGVDGPRTNFFENRLPVVPAAAIPEKVYL